MKKKGNKNGSKNTELLANGPKKREQRRSKSG
jgi:hypothetical protein